jgi:hypothetical protein
MIERSARQQEYMRRTGSLAFDPPITGDTITTYVSISARDRTLTKAYLDSLDLPFQNIRLEEDDKIAKYPYIIGDVVHPKGKYWWEVIQLYKSGYSGTSFVVPMWGTSDPIVIHLCILYALSIIVRYLPSLWHDIEDGAFNHMRALIEHYLAIVDNVLPKLAIEVITGRKLRVDQPGSLHGPA